MLWDAYNYAYVPYHYGVSHVNTVWKNGNIAYTRGEQSWSTHYLKKNAKFIDREVTKWSEMIKDWEEGVEIFGAVNWSTPF